MNRPADDARGQDRIAELDGVRGLAIVMIVFYHLYGGSRVIVAASQSRGDRWFARLVEANWASVDMFFVLSGFLITGILLGSKRGGGYFRNFYGRRFLRIFPLYYGFLFALIVVLPLFRPGDPDLETLRANQGWYWTYLFNVFVPLRPATDLGLYGNGHLWSLAIEEQFYLVWPLIVLLLNVRWLTRVCLIAIAGALIFRVALVSGVVPRLDNNYSAVMLMPARIDSLAFGALLAIAARSPAVLARLGAWAPAGAAVAVGTLVVLFAARGGLSYFDPYVQTLGLSAAALLWAAMIARALTAASPGHWLRAALGHRTLRFYGRYSYAMYLFHLQIALIMMRITEDWAIAPTLGTSIPARLLFTAAGFAMVTLLGWLSWHLYEKQFLKLKRFFPYRAAAAPKHEHAERVLAEEPAAVPSA